MTPSVHSAAPAHACSTSAHLPSPAPTALPDAVGHALAWGLRYCPPEQIATAPCLRDGPSVADMQAASTLCIEIDARPWIVVRDMASLSARLRAQQWAAQPGAVLATSEPDAIDARLSELGQRERAIDTVTSLRAAAVADDQVDITLGSLAQEQSAVVRLVASTLFDACAAGASDIHLESTETGMAVKYRIDGVMHETANIGGVSYAEQAISRLKVLARLDIGERRVPQDGRFNALVQGRSVDFRLSIMPSVHGEDAVLRLLDKQGKRVDCLDALAFDTPSLAQMRSLLRAPHGMVLVTGPTGSGKSTTLYAALSELRTGREKIITIEDPVEYALDGILQIPVNEKKGLTFAKGLRAILRHDPDIILVGEIRDAETANIAVQAALTGHLVLSSVHANGAFSIMERFLYMGVDTPSLLEALNGVIAQRLLRRVCAACTTTAGDPDGETASDPGCPQCRHTGYKGRIAVAETLRMTTPLKDAFRQRASMAAIRQTALEDGFVPLPQRAKDAVAAGLTTWEEVRRVIAMD